jgi:hypothetical protein
VDPDFAHPSPIFASVLCCAEEEASSLLLQRQPLPSPALIKTWRTAQRMRQWLQFSDAAAAQVLMLLPTHIELSI